MSAIRCGKGGKEVPGAAAGGCHGVMAAGWGAGRHWPQQQEEWGPGATSEDGLRQSQLQQWQSELGRRRGWLRQQMLSVASLLLSVFPDPGGPERSTAPVGFWPPQGGCHQQQR